LRLGNLQPGESRPLAHDEVAELYRSALDQRRHQKPARPKSSKQSSSSATKSTDERDTGFSESSPIIDRSLPTDSPDEVDLTTLLAAPDFNPNDKSNPPSSKPIDLSRIVTGKSPKQRRTVIGGQLSKPAARHKQPRGNRRRKTRAPRHKS
jgi:hypothetical protein